MVSDPLLLPFGLSQFVPCTRVCSNTVGLPPFFGPLNTSTQFLMLAFWVLVATAVPLPTLALPQSAIAWPIVVLARFFVHFGIPLVLIFPSSSYQICVRFTKPPCGLTAGWA